MPVTAADLQKRLKRRQKNPKNDNNTNNGCGNSNDLVIKCVSLSIQTTEKRPRAWPWRCFHWTIMKAAAWNATNDGKKQERMFEDCQFCSQVYIDRKCETNNISISPLHTHARTCTLNVRWMLLRRCIWRRGQATAWSCLDRCTPAGPLLL